MIQAGRMNSCGHCKPSCFVALEHGCNCICHDKADPPTAEPQTLAVCPFCGGEAVSDGQSMYLRTDYYVFCSQCGATTPRDHDAYDKEVDAIAAWNRRCVPPSAQPGEREPGSDILLDEATELLRREGLLATVEALNALRAAVVELLRLYDYPRYAATKSEFAAAFEAARRALVLRVGEPMPTSDKEKV